MTTEEKKKNLTIWENIFRIIGGSMVVVIILSIGCIYLDDNEKVDMAEVMAPKSMCVCVFCILVFGLLFSNYRML